MNITLYTLKEHVNYDKETGIFTWIKPFYKNQTQLVGKQIGSLDSLGYLEASINKNRIRLHRLAWFYIHGYLPKYIDHINHVKTDNRLVNLRAVTNQDNSKNASISKANSSGITGVYYSKTKNKWIANVCINGNTKYIGSYQTKEVAGKARAEYNLIHNFHTNHGGTTND